MPPGIISVISPRSTPSAAQLALRPCSIEADANEGGPMTSPAAYIFVYLGSAMTIYRNDPPIT